MASEVWKAAAVPWKLALMLARHLNALLHALHRLDGVAQRLARRQVKADHGGRELVLVADRQLRVRLLPVGHHAQRNLRTVARLHVEIVQRRGDRSGSSVPPPSPRGTG